MKDFQEIQRPNLWLVYAILLPVTGLFVFGGVKQLIYGEPWGNNPAPNIMLVCIILFMLIPFVYLLFMKLYTCLDKDKVYIYFRGLQFRPTVYTWDQIESYEIKKTMLQGSLYSFGIKIGYKKKSYTAGGNATLSLRLVSGTKIQISTRRPRELMEFFERLDAQRNEK